MSGCWYQIFVIIEIYLLSNFMCEGVARSQQKRNHGQDMARRIWRECWLFYGNAGTIDKFLVRNSPTMTVRECGNEDGKKRMVRQTKNSDSAALTQSSFPVYPQRKYQIH